jgi:hypothetical protein
MKQVLIALFIIVPAIVSAQDGCGNPKILMMGTYSGALTDSTVREHLTSSMGFTEVDYSAPADMPPEDVIAEGYELIIFTNTAFTDNLSAYGDLEIPIINFEAWNSLASLNMVKTREDADGFIPFNNVPYKEDNENSFNRLFVNQGDSAVSIGLTAGYGGDTLTVFTEDVPFHNNQHPGYWATPNENAYPVLEYTEATLLWMAENDPTICGADFCLQYPRYAAFVYDKDVEMENGFTAPEKRGFFFFHRNTASVVSSQVWDIFDAMIYWFLGCLERPEVNNTSLENNRVNFDLQLYPNPSHGSINLSLTSGNIARFDIRVYNNLGQVIHHKTTEGTNEISYRILIDEPGFYTLKILNTKNNSSITQRFTIQ